MKKNNLLWKNLLIKISFIAVLALLMLIPLSMVRKSVNERSYNYAETINDITKSWGASQMFTGPWLFYKYSIGTDKEKENVKAAIYPDSLKYTVNTTSQVLHRSIYDVPVYTAELTIKGNFVLDKKLPGISIWTILVWSRQKRAMTRLRSDGDFDFIHQFFSSYIGRKFAWKDWPNSLNLRQIYIR